MEFFCVLSVGGSLASYGVQQEGAAAFKAVLRPQNGRRDDLPAEIVLQKQEGEWQAEPWHSEVVPGLINAIEAGDNNTVPQG